VAAFTEPEGPPPVGLDERVRVEVTIRVVQRPVATVLELGRTYTLDLGWHGRSVTGTLESVKRTSAGAVWLFICGERFGTVGYSMADVTALATA